MACRLMWIAVVSVAVLAARVGVADETPPPPFPVDSIDLQRRVEQLEQEQRKLLTALEGLLNAVEELEENKGTAAAPDPSSGSVSVNPAARPQVAAVPVLQVYAPAWCGVCTEWKNDLRKVGAEQGTQSVRLEWIAANAPFHVASYPAIFDPRKNQYLTGRLLINQLESWATGK